MVLLAEQTVPIPTRDLISWIFDDVPYDQDKPVYIDANNPERSISAKQARTLIRKLTAGYRKLGVRPGHKDVVCVHAFNDIMYSIHFLGIIAAGGIFAGTNPGYTPYELAHHLRTSETRFIVTEPEMLDSIVKATKECDIPESNILIFNVLGQIIPKGFVSWEILLNQGEEDWVRFDDLETAKTTEAARLFSSGTTGLPKAAMISHYNLVAEHTLLFANNKRDYEVRRVLPLPMFHAAVLPIAHTSTLKLGDTAWVMRRFELKEFLSIIESRQITDLLLVPPVVIATIMSPLTGQHDLRSLRYALCGAAPLGKGPQKKFEELMGNNGVFTQVFGMTELSCVATTLNWPEQDYTGSVGYPLPNLDVKLVDESGADMTDYNVYGELCFRGPTVFMGYLNNAEANKPFDWEGFYHTGDMGYRVRGGKNLWYIVDRKKELLKVRGFQVAPPELEAVLLGHPQIIDAAVIGVQYEASDSQMPRAYVVKRPTPEGDRLSEQEIRNFMRDKLAKYKELTGGVQFVSEIPKNGSGKILKRVLRERAKKEMGVRL